MEAPWYDPEGTLIEAMPWSQDHRDRQRLGLAVSVALTAYKRLTNAGQVVDLHDLVMTFNRDWEALVHLDPATLNVQVEMIWPNGSGLHDFPSAPNRSRSAHWKANDEDPYIQRCHERCPDGPVRGCGGQGGGW